MPTSPILSGFMSVFVLSVPFLYFLPRTKLNERCLGKIPQTPATAEKSKIFLLVKNPLNHILNDLKIFVF